MSLEDNCGKFGRTKIIFFVTLPGGLVLCVPGQYRLFPPLAALTAASRRAMPGIVVEAYLLQGSEGVVQGSAPIYPAGPGEAHQDSEADCP